MLNKVLLIVFLVLNFLVFSQEKELVIQQRIEFISEQYESEDIDLTDVMQVLQFRISNPLNLNSATKEDLEELNLLTEIQIKDLLQHRVNYGKLINIYELQSLKYWDLETIQLILPFVKVEDRTEQLHVSFKEMLKKGRFDWFGRYQRILETKKGYTAPNDSVLKSSNSFYYGNPDKYYTRFRYSYRNNISIGLTAEKDPGEQFFKGAQKQGFDFYSAHAFYKGGKYLKAVAIGDFQVQIGQGLNLWTGYAMGKTTDVVTTKKSATPLKPYTSSDEMRFLRGAGVDLAYKSFQLTLFGSIKKIDGAVQSVDTTSINDLEVYSPEESISSISTSGLHRTNTEIAKKGSLTEFIYGGNLRFERRNLHIGIAAVNWGYNKSYAKPIQAYNQFDFRGKNTTSISLDYNYLIQNFNFFGEVSYSSFTNSWATIHGVIIALDNRASLSFVYRNYQKGYNTFYNAAFAESGRSENTNNENGIFSGLNLTITNYLFLNTYFDLFQFPWLKYQVNKPSYGHDFLVQPIFKPNKRIEIYVRFRQHLRQKNSLLSDGSIKEVEEVMQRNYRFNISYKVSGAFTLKSRVEFLTLNRLSNKTEKGILLTQDISYKPKKAPIELAVRYALFDTDSYNSRIYAVESNALYTYSVPAYYYQGSRAYLLFRLHLFKHIDLWVKYGVFLYNNRKNLGSGAEMINNNRKQDLTIQLRVKF
ncbi:MAG: helix-hairpin-helix domain-containing protein [Crocinitomicaceae bacterium]|nr:helix-hairpin-helix domain-containing protein [Crocinitomicaceae bacterium]